MAGKNIICVVGGERVGCTYLANVLSGHMEATSFKIVPVVSMVTEAHIVAKQLSPQWAIQYADAKDLEVTVLGGTPREYLLRKSNRIRREKGTGYLAEQTLSLIHEVTQDGDMAIVDEILSPDDLRAFYDQATQCGHSVKVVWVCTPGQGIDQNLPLAKCGVPYWVFINHREGIPQEEVNILTTF